MTESHPQPIPREDLWNPAVEAVMNLKIFHERIVSAESAVLKRHGLSGPKYNLLRILRGAENHTLPCSEIGRRMVHRVPDVTRLVNRLAEDGFVRRHKSDADGRVVLVSLQPDALPILAELDLPVLRFIEKTVEGLAPDRLAQFIELLREALGDEAARRPDHAEEATSPAVATLDATSGTP